MDLRKHWRKGAAVPGRSEPDVRRERAVWPRKRVGTGQFEPLGLYAEVRSVEVDQLQVEERDGLFALGVLDDAADLAIGGEHQLANALDVVG